MILVFIMMAAVHLALQVLFLVFGHRALSSVTQPNRAMSPWQLYLNLIPVFQFGWAFRSVDAIAGSLKREALAKAIDDGHGSYGRRSGIVGYVFYLLAIVLVVAVLLPAAGLNKPQYSYNGYVSQKELTTLGHLLFGLGLASFLAHAVLMVIHFVTVSRWTKLVRLAQSGAEGKASARLAAKRSASGRKKKPDVTAEGSAEGRGGDSGTVQVCNSRILVAMGLAGAILATLCFLLYRGGWLANIVNLANLAGATIALTACLARRSGQADLRGTGVAGFAVSIMANMVLALGCHNLSSVVAFLFLAGMLVQISGSALFTRGSGRQSTLVA